jgi:hypothetical protein
MPKFIILYDLTGKKLISKSYKSVIKSKISRII